METRIAEKNLENIEKLFFVYLWENKFVESGTIVSRRLYKYIDRMYQWHNCLSRVYNSEIPGFEIMW